MKPPPPADLAERLHAEQRRVRRTVWLVTLLPVALAIGLLVVTAREVGEANAAVEAAETDYAELQDSVAVVQSVLDDMTRQADQRRRELDSLRTLSESLESGLARIDRPLAAATVEAAQTEFQVAQRRPRLYIQVRKGDARGERRARQVIDLFRQREYQNRYEVPVLERVERVPTRSDLRYYNADDRAVAERIGRLVEQETGLGLQVRDMSEFVERGAVQPGTFEIWVGAR